MTNIIWNVAVSKFRFLTKLRSNMISYYSRKSVSSYSLNIRSHWGRLTENLFFILHQGERNPKILRKKMFEHPSYFIILTEVPGQIIDQFFLKDLPAFFNNLGISSIPNVQPRKLTAVFSESKWGNYPSLLQLVGICDGYHLTYPIPEIVDVKSALGYTPRWRLEDILQITFYGYLVIAEQLIPKVQGYPLDISEELILQHQALPIMKVYYPPSGYISSILTPLKIEAIAIILQQYIDLLEFDLNTFISPRTGLTLERILLADWIVKGDLPIFPRW